MPSLRSRPTTRPRPPIRSAAARATTPVPQATSSTAWPGATPPASTRWGAHSANRAGTNWDSYTSAASTESWNVSTVPLYATSLVGWAGRATIPGGRPGSIGQLPYFGGQGPVGILAP